MPFIVFYTQIQGMLFEEGQKLLSLSLWKNVGQLMVVSHTSHWISCACELPLCNFSLRLLPDLQLSQAILQLLLQLWMHPILIFTQPCEKVSNKQCCSQLQCRQCHDMRRDRTQGISGWDQWSQQLQMWEILLPSRRREKCNKCNRNRITGDVRDGDVVVKSFLAQFPRRYGYPLAPNLHLRLVQRITAAPSLNLATDSHWQPLTMCDNLTPSWHISLQPL